MLHGLCRGDSSRGGTKKSTSVTLGGRVMVYNPMAQYDYVRAYLRVGACFDIMEGPRKMGRE